MSGDVAEILETFGVWRSGPRQSGHYGEVPHALGGTPPVQVRSLEQWLEADVFSAFWAAVRLR
jgi:hypothetical protein